MKILIVSFVFPPHNVIGAIRVGKTAKYLHRLGHEVRVIAARDLSDPSTLRLEIPPDNVVYTRWRDVDRPYRAMLGLWHRVRSRRQSSTHGGAGGDGNGGRQSTTRPGITAQATNRRSVGRLVRLAYTDLFHLPDAAVGWRRPATRAGRALMDKWRPDVILASGAPWTSFLVARDLAKEADVPWVADLRDPWAGNPDTVESELRRRVIDSWYERHVLSSAAYLVTVTEPLAAKLRERYPGKPVAVVLNGFDTEDYPQELSSAAGSDRHAAVAVSGADGSSEPRDGVLRLVYTGTMYRDMTPLLEAVAMLGRDAQALRIEIIGVSDRSLRDRYSSLAEQLGITDRLEWLPAVPYAEAIDRQRHADVLFVLVHDTPYDAGIYTGKLLEYVGARRPILIVGTATGVAADLVRERRLGAAERTPERIAERLRAWIHEKRRLGMVSAFNGAAVDDFSRENQTRRFAEILRNAAAAQ